MAQRGTTAGAQPEHDEETSFAIHHMMPQHYGGLVVADFVFLPPPAVDAAAASRPANPGMPPLWHGSVPLPEAFRPIAPPLPGVVPAAPARPAAQSAQPSIPRPAPAPAAPAPAPAPAAPQKTTQISDQYVVEESPISLIVGPMLEAFDPLYALALFLAAGLGSFVIPKLETRYIVLWSILLALGGLLTLVDSRQARRHAASGDMVWGLGIGLAIGLPLVVFVSSGLAHMSILLFPYATEANLFETVIILIPISETLFYRGVLQERRGIAASVIGAGLGSLLLFWPAGAAANAIGTVIGVSFFLAALAAVYSYVRQRFGLAASLTCQVTLSLFLFFIPRLLYQLVANP